MSLPSKGLNVPRLPLIAMLFLLLTSCVAGAHLVGAPKGLSPLCDQAARDYRTAIRLGQSPKETTLDALYLCIRYEAIKTACFEADTARLAQWGKVIKDCEHQAEGP